jgi:hypothetical protein
VLLLQGECRNHSREQNGKDADTLNSIWFHVGSPLRVSACADRSSDGKVQAMNEHPVRSRMLVNGPVPIKKHHMYHIISISIRNNLESNRKAAKSLTQSK